MSIKVVYLRGNQSVTFDTMAMTYTTRDTSKEEYDIMFEVKKGNFLATIAMLEMLQYKEVN